MEREYLHRRHPYGSARAIAIARLLRGTAQRGNWREAKMTTPFLHEERRGRIAILTMDRADR
jgi:hypothetical protein